MQGIYFFRVEYLLLGNYLGEVQLAIAPVAEQKPRITRCVFWALSNI